MQFPFKYKSDGKLNLQLLERVREQTIYGRSHHEISYLSTTLFSLSIVSKQSETIVILKTWLFSSGSRRCSANQRKCKMYKMVVGQSYNTTHVCQRRCSAHACSTGFFSHTLEYNFY